MTFTMCTREKELGQTSFIPLGSRISSDIYRVSSREVPKDFKRESLKSGGCKGGIQRITDQLTSVHRKNLEQTPKQSIQKQQETIR